jgi:hypothetical protein
VRACLARSKNRRAGRGYGARRCLHEPFDMLTWDNELRLDVLLNRSVALSAHCSLPSLVFCKLRAYVGPNSLIHLLCLVRPKS